jgi:hypothetical protein
MMLNYAVVYITCDFRFRQFSLKVGGVGGGGQNFIKEEEEVGQMGSVTSSREYTFGQ